ncbi:YeeE/YedE family protein [Bacteroidota bacterium]
MELVYGPWPWYTSGIMIAIVMFLLLMMGKPFGVSSNLKTLCTLCGAGNKVDFFNFDWKSQKWNLLVIAGAAIGGFIATNFLNTNTSIALNPDTVQNLNELGFKNAGENYLPTELFQFTSLKSVILLALGGLLVGFGTRYAGGCTSGHAISGLSNFQLPSLVAVIGFFIGGLTMIHLLFPLIF